MEPIQWTTDYELDIPVIDNQHKRIVDYINQLCVIIEQKNTDAIQDVIQHLVDYTHSHFTFEEAMLEEVGYDALTIHQATHRAFTQRISQFLEKSNNLADAQVLATLLKQWLLEHIQHDDASYADLVREQMQISNTAVQKSWIKKALGRYFKD